MYNWFEITYAVKNLNASCSHCRLVLHDLHNLMLPAQKTPNLRFKESYKSAEKKIYGSCERMDVFGVIVVWVVMLVVCPSSPLSILIKEKKIQWTN